MIYPSLFFSSPPLHNGFSSLGVDLQGISCCSAHCGPVNAHRIIKCLGVYNVVKFVPDITECCDMVVYQKETELTTVL